VVSSWSEDGQQAVRSWSVGGGRPTFCPPNCPPTHHILTIYCPPSAHLLKVSEVLMSGAGHETFFCELADMLQPFLGMAQRPGLGSLSDGILSYVLWDLQLLDEFPGDEGRADLLEEVAEALQHVRDVVDLEGGGSFRGARGSGSSGSGDDDGGEGTYGAGAQARLVPLCCAICYYVVCCTPCPCSDGAPHSRRQEGCHVGQGRPARCAAQDGGGCPDEHGERERGAVPGAGARLRDCRGAG
jgi:hypothetical protein